MSKSTTDRHDVPASDQLDPEVLAFRQQFGDRSPLDEIVQEGARRMLQAAIDAEVEAFIEDHQHRRDENGRRLMVKNGSLPAREILTGAGPIPIKQGRVRDNSADRESRVEFSPSILPAYLKRTDAIEELIPRLPVKGAVSQRNLHQRLWRGPASARRREGQGTLSANVIVRLKEQRSDEYDEWISFQKADHGGSHR